MKTSHAIEAAYDTLHDHEELYLILEEVEANVQDADEAWRSIRELMDRLVAKEKESEQGEDDGRSN